MDIGHLIRVVPKYFQLSIFVSACFLSEAGDAQTCHLLSLEGNEIAAVASSGAVGVPMLNASSYEFVGITARNAMTRRQELFANPSIVNRGGVTSCWMISGGYTDEEDGVVYDFGGQFIGWVKDNHEVEDRRGNVVASYSEACDEFPTRLKMRLVGGAALLMLLHDTGDRVSDYWLTFPTSTCYWSASR